MSFSPSPYMHDDNQQSYSSPSAQAPFSPSSFSPAPAPFPPPPNRNSNKPTGKGSRGPYKPRANKLAAAATPSASGGPLSSVSPQRAPSTAPKRVRPSKKKQKERSLSLEDDIDDDDLVDGAGDQRMSEAGREDDYDGEGRRSTSVLGGSRAGTPMGGGGRRRESTLEKGGEGNAATGLDDAEEEEEEDEGDEMGGGAAGEAKEVKERLDEVKEAQMLLVDHMDKNQRARFDSWKTSSFPRAQMKKYIIQTTTHTISDELAQIVGGISKVYVGLIIRKAREVQQAQGHTGPLTPFHLREAHRLYALDSRSAKRPGSGTRKKALFTR